MLFPISQTYFIRRTQLLLLLSVATVAGWSQAPPPPPVVNGCWTIYTTDQTGGNSDVQNSIFVDGPRIFATPSAAEVIMSPNDGASWEFAIAQTSNDVFSAGQDIIIGTDGSGVWRSNNGGTTFIGLDIDPMTTADAQVNAVFGVGTGFATSLDVYVGTENGIYVTDDGVLWTNFNSSDGLVSDVVLSIYVEGSNIYVGTDSGLSFSTNNGLSWTTKTTSDGIASNTIRGIYAEGNNIYLATSGGVSISHNGGSSWDNYGLANGLASLIIHNLTKSGNTLYAATVGGLALSKNDGLTWHNFEMASGLSSNVINDVQVANNKIYLATLDGIDVSEVDCLDALIQEPIPTMGQWAIISLCLLALILGTLVWSMSSAKNLLVKPF